MSSDRHSQFSRGQRAVPIGGMSCKLHDCPIPVPIGEDPREWYMPVVVFDTYAKHPFRQFFRESFVMMPDDEVQMFLEWDGFEVVRENGCFVLTKGNRRITLSAARARDLLLVSVVDTLAVIS